MKRLSILRELSGPIAIALIAAMGTGCYTMARVPSGYVTTKKPAQVVVRDADGAIFAINNPTIVKDSIIGMSDREDTLSMNLRDVDAMVVRQYSKPKTYGLIAGLTVGAGLLTLGAMQAGLLGDCLRIANRNNMCIQDVSSCKYDGGCGVTAP